MSNRTLAILGIVFAALAIAVGLLVWGGSDSATSDEDALSLDEYSAGAVDTVTMSRTGGKPVTLTKVDGVWKVGAKNANGDQISGLFKELASLKNVTLASKNPDNHEKLGATKKLGTVLTFTRDGKKTTFIIGNGGDTVGSFYIKRDGDKTVWLATADELQAKLAQDAKTWATAPAKATPNSTELPAGMQGLPGMQGGAPPGSP